MTELHRVMSIYVSRQVTLLLSKIFILCSMLINRLPGKQGKFSTKEIILIRYNFGHWRDILSNLYSRTELQVHCHMSTFISLCNEWVWSFSVWQHGEIILPSRRKFLSYSSLRPSSPSVSLSHEGASINLLSFSSRGQTDWKPQSQETNQFDHMDHSLV